MKIIVTNDDGIEAEGVKALVRALRAPGRELIVVCPKTAQSGMSMAVTMGHKPIAVKKVSGGPEQWWYLDGTPASCVKYAIDNILFPQRPDLVVAGVNHGANAATASVYSGTVGAAMEGAVNGIPSIAVSLDSFSPTADFSAVEELLPGVLERLLPNMTARHGAFYNINFPLLQSSAIKGVKVCRMGMGHWEKEYREFLPYLKEKDREPRPEDLEYIRNLETGEDVVVMAGDFVSEEQETGNADHMLLAEGWITITPENIDNTDYGEIDRLCAII